MARVVLPSRFVMPAEWAPHEATWLSWPHNRETWPDELEQAQAALAAGVEALAEGEAVHINTTEPAPLERRFPALIGRRRVVLHPIPTNDAWCRDHGAIVVRDGNGDRVALDFRFNAWGGKYPPWDLDDAVAPAMAATLGLPCVSVDMVLEGGAIDVNGEGTLLTTEQCLLNPNRNPTMGRGDIEAMLARYLGARRVVWLGEGIVGDDTDGHVDDITRFVAPATVVTVVARDPADENYAPLQDNLARLARVRLPDGRPLEVLQLPMPPALRKDGKRLPASYANFYIGNRVVLVPTFGAAEEDEAAVALLARSFPGRRMVPIDARALVVGLGTFHCLTQQIPAPSAEEPHR